MKIRTYLATSALAISGLAGAAKFTPYLTTINGSVASVDVHRREVEIVRGDLTKSKVVLPKDALIRVGGKVGSLFDARPGEQARAIYRVTDPENVQVTLELGPAR